MSEGIQEPNLHKYKEQLSKLKGFSWVVCCGRQSLAILFGPKCTGSLPSVPMFSFCSKTAPQKHKPPLPRPLHMRKGHTQTGHSPTPAPQATAHEKVTLKQATPPPQLSRIPPLSSRKESCLYYNKKTTTHTCLFNLTKSC